MARHKTRRAETFDNHQGVSDEEVRTLLKFFRIPDQEWNEWINGQTCPILPNGKMGYFWWDVKRFIDWKEKGVLPVWD
jgi:hypothetical protein